MNKHLIRTMINLLILSTLLLSACKGSPQTQPDQTEDAIAEPETTPPVLAQTKTTTPTASATPLPTATPTHTPTSTLAWGSRVYAQTPLPQVESTISIENIPRLQPLAVWGNARANTIALSPDGLVFAVGTDLGGFLYDSQTFTQLGIAYTSLPVHAIAFSSDNVLLAFCLSDGTMEIYNRNGLNLLHRIEDGFSFLANIDHITTSFSSNGREILRVIETQENILVDRWQVDTWRQLNSFTINSGPAIYISPSLDLAGVIVEEDIRLQSLTYPDESDLLDIPVRTIPYFWNRLLSSGGEITPAVSGEFLLINNGTGLVHWQILEDDYTYILEWEPDEVPNPCNTAPDSCLNQVGGLSWDCDEGSAVQPIASVTMTPDDIMILISLNENRTEFRRASDGFLVWDIDGIFSEVVFSPGGEYFIGLRPNGFIEKRDTLEGNFIDYLELHPGQLNDFGFSPDGDVMAVGYSNDWIRVFSAENGQDLGVLSGEARSLQFSPDGTLLAAGLSDGTVRIFELNEGSSFTLSPGHRAAVTDLAFSQDGARLLTGSEDCTASLWDIPGRYRVWTLKPDPAEPFRISNVALSTDSTTCFFSGNRQGIYTYYQRELKSILFPLQGGISGLSLFPTGEYLAVAGEINWLQPDPASFTPPSPLQLDETTRAQGYAVAFHPENDLLALATDQSIEFWTLGNSSFVWDLPIHSLFNETVSPVELTFSPDGSLLVLATSNGLLHVFGIPLIPAN